MPQHTYFLEHRFIYTKPRRLFSAEIDTILYTQRAPSHYFQEPQFMDKLPPPFDIPSATSGPFYHQITLIYEYPHSPPGKAHVVWSIGRPVNEFDLPLGGNLPPRAILPAPDKAPVPNYPIAPIVPSPLATVRTINPIPIVPQYPILPVGQLIFQPLLPTVATYTTKGPPPPFAGSTSGRDHDWISAMCGCMWHTLILKDGTRATIRGACCNEPWCRWPV
ncbi:hypothetical protein TWF718_001434 [Orbilia javanica]|uniref:Uncharacterized protein n=1 Tax=Orbilia javanica TaxID=47235 RepID=A0AAN8N1B0_9PEZI